MTRGGGGRGEPPVLLERKEERTLSTWTSAPGWYSSDVLFLASNRVRRSLIHDRMEAAMPAEAETARRSL